MSVKIVEVGPRDGLQNEPTPVSVEDRLALIERLVAAGLRHIEVGAFVSPTWVPQMAGSDELLRRLPHHEGVHYSALVPNLRGLEAALAAGCREVAVFVAATESFSQRNQNCGIEDSLARARAVATEAQRSGLAVRGYVSCVLGCPFEGPVAPGRTAELTARLLAAGCHEVSLGDTLGAGTPASTAGLLRACLQRAPAECLAGHFHDTYGMAIANIAAALALGLRCFDSAIAGLGGCPYAPGATGNVATEDLVYLLDGMGHDSGVSLPRLAAAAEHIGPRLGRPNASRVGQALARRVACA
ncbi:MAG: hydroxymethylglutaryl-CoA lyase [Burkholderiales bacterium]|nr:hydroxymethylglutaryl-CoA lyase [Burkholderiales bacterium]